MKSLNAGENCVLLEFDTVKDVVAAYDLLDVERSRGVVELVPSQRCLLVEFDGKALTRRDVESIASAYVDVEAASLPVRHESVDVRYDGEDLDEVCEHLGLDREQFVEWHSRSPWTTAFTGFAPGFAYMVRSDHTRPIPRLHEPRLKVPAGAVALGGDFTGIYPRESPGGWRIVGYTDAELWNLERTPAALLTPGTLVNFRAIP